MAKKASHTLERHGTISSKARCGFDRSRTSNLHRCTLSHPNSWTRNTLGWKRGFRDQTHTLNRPATTQTRENHLPPSTLKSTVYSRCLRAAMLLLQTINMLKILCDNNFPRLRDLTQNRTDHESQEKMRKIGEISSNRIARLSATPR